MSLQSSSFDTTGAGALAAMMAAGLSSGQDSAKMVDWALATVADAEKRMSNLQARIDYLEALSVTDELTGLYNRRGFASHLDRALAAARRGGPRGTLLICDLNGFKEINDNYGHASGDEVLRQVARILAMHVRRTDTIGRLGGDEFAVLLVGATEAGAEQKAAGLRHLIGGTRLVHGGKQFAIGISIGFAHYTGEELEADLFRRADHAMYAEKRRAQYAGRAARPRAFAVASAA